MKQYKRIVAMLLAACMTAGLAGCASGGETGQTTGQTSAETMKAAEESEASQQETEAATDAETAGSEGTDTIAGGEPVTLLVDMHGWMPTVNKEVTEENPTVFLSPQTIADKFMEMYPNVTIEWARTKPVGALQAETAEWFTTQINAGNCPAIAFSWGTQYQDRDWYVPLDEYLDTPNEFVEGNEAWRDLFPEYLWKNSGIADANQNVVAIPIALYAGPATGYFYNKDAFEELGLEVPKTWEEFIAVAKKLDEAGYTGVAPSTILPNITFGSWVEQFSVGPYIAAGIMEETDYDKDGQVTTVEQLRATKEGIYNPVDKEYAKEFFYQLKRYYTEVLETGWESTDYITLWNEGKVGMREDGTWILQSENSNKERKCEYGVFAVPPLQSDTTEFAADAEYTESGPYQPDLDLQLNIMKPAVEGKPEVLEAAVKFLKFLTTPENVSAMVLEQGADIGAVKDADVPPILAEWINQPFAITPKTNWPGAFTDEQGLALDSNFELWVKGNMGDDEFFAKVNEIQQAGADDYIESMSIDTSEW